MFLQGVLVFIFSTLLITKVQASGGEGIFVTLPDGTQLLGSQEGEIATFKGIPYAQPPLGELRFVPPQPFVNSNVSQVLDATKHGHLCIQLMWGDDGLFDDGSEDCLTLNVFVSAAFLESRKDSAEAERPVAVYVHGGSYINGGGSLPLYDGVDMLEYMQGRAILVTLNYRLNAFGFLGSNKLRSLDAASGSTGNYGIQDQRLAFQWVQDNIAAFGGDRSRVTIFGESAGAGSVTNHLVMPRSVNGGYYAQAIMESGAFAEWTATSMACAERMFDIVASECGCDGDHKHVAKCMQTVSAKRLEAGSSKAYVTSGCGWAPVVDGVELTTHPWIAAANGDVKDVPVMLGTNADEGAIFTALTHKATAEDVDAYWTTAGYNETERATLTELYVTDKVYPDMDFGTVYWWAAERSLGDEWMTCPSEYASRQLGQQQAENRRSSDTYFYHFEHKPRDAPVTRHVSELQYTFHQSELTNFPADAQMADSMASYWLNFFETGDPNGRRVDGVPLPQWSPFDVAQDNVLAIVDSTEIFAVYHMKASECQFSINRVDASVHEDYPTGAAT